MLGLFNIQVALSELEDGNCIRSQIFYFSDRKILTKKLKLIEKLCHNYSGIECEFLDVANAADFRSQITAIFSSLISRFNKKERGESRGDEEYTLRMVGDFSNDLMELALTAGISAKESGSSICLLINEIHRLPGEELEALTALLHRCGQKNLPVCVFGAGHSKILRNVGKANPDAEMLFEFHPLQPLPSRHNSK